MPTTVARVSAIVRRAFNARVTDTIRPLNARYGAPYSWHKVGQAVDFVPAAGVTSITRPQVKAVMDANDVRIIELLGPGNPGHANHWHLAFARPGQLIDRHPLVGGTPAWVIDVAHTDPASLVPGRAAAASAPSSTAEAPPSWDVFAAAEWQTVHGGHS